MTELQMTNLGSIFLKVQSCTALKNTSIAKNLGCYDPNNQEKLTFLICTTERDDCSPPEKGLFFYPSQELEIFSVDSGMGGGPESQILMIEKK